MGILFKEKKFGSYLAPYIKIKSKQIIELRVKPKTLKFLEIFVPVKQKFLRYDIKSMMHKGKNDKLDLIKIKVFYSSKSC